MPNSEEHIFRELEAQRHIQPVGFSNLMTAHLWESFYTKSITSPTPKLTFSLTYETSTTPTSSSHALLLVLNPLRFLRGSTPKYPPLLSFQILPELLCLPPWASDFLLPGKAADNPASYCRYLVSLSVSLAASSADLRLSHSVP